MEAGHGVRRAKSRRPGARWTAAILAIVVNLGFIAFLVFSVTWQNRRETPVSVELYAPQPPVAKVETPKAPEPAPPPEPPKPPPEQPRPEPAPPQPQPAPPKPAPKVEPPAPTKAEIAEKAKREQAERARIEKEKRETEKREAEKKKQEEKRLAEARERQTREAEALKAQAERERVVAAKAVEAAQAKALDDYIRRIQARIKGNVVLPPDMTGNPEAVFDVLQLPTGEIIDVQLRKSSGVRAYDEAVQRAIIKASPLPKPDVAELFRRNLTLKFRPSD